MGRRVILNPEENQIVYEGANAGYADGVLWIWTLETDLAAVVLALTDPANTSKIRYEYGEMADEWEDMSSFNYAGVNSEGHVTFALRKGAAT